MTALNQRLLQSIDTKEETMTNINEGWWRKMSRIFVSYFWASGCGKGTVSRIIKEKQNIIFSLSATTRNQGRMKLMGLIIFPRGRRISTKVANNEFRICFVHNNYYGTPKDL